eukprot:SAG11_NODE_2548_length_3231_cov_14.685504_4_plen_31_part_00
MHGKLTILMASGEYALVSIWYLGTSLYRYL